MTMQPMIDGAETDDFEQVKLDPGAWYDAPRAILDDKQLQRAEKHALLAEWSRDLTDRSAAATEGMVPDKPGMIDADNKMRDKVVAALAELDADEAEEASLSLPARLWRRITAG